MPHDEDPSPAVDDHRRDRDGDDTQRSARPDAPHRSDPLCGAPRHRTAHDYDARVRCRTHARRQSTYWETSPSSAAGPACATGALGEHDDVVGEAERVAHVLLDEEDRGAGVADRARGCGTPRRRRSARDRATARRPRAASVGSPSRAPARACAARRPRGSRRPASSARRGAGTARRPGASAASTPLAPERRRKLSSRFSRTVSDANTDRPSGACTIPRRAIWNGLSSCTGSPSKQHLAAGRAHQPGGDAGDGGLARAVRAEQRGHRPRAHGERHAEQRAERSVRRRRRRAARAAASARDCGAGAGRAPSRRVHTVSPR